MLSKRILVTGGDGLVGHAFRKVVPHAIFLSFKDVDLRDESQTMNCFKYIKPHYVIHLAAKVGGIAANYNFTGTFFTDNIRINTNVLDACKNYKVEKIVSFLSTCIYPDKENYPLVEDHIHNGEPHFTNFGYAYAKRMLHIQSRAYRRQYGCNFLCVVPNNLYGENDNFDLQNAHVIPALIRKIHEAKINNNSLNIWGDGEVYREFTYVNDVVKIVNSLLTSSYAEDMPLNIGNPTEILLNDVIKRLCEIMDFCGEIKYDITKPKGQLRKPSSNARLLKLMAVEYITLQEGLKKTCDWFVENYPNVRGVT